MPDAADIDPNVVKMIATYERALNQYRMDLNAAAAQYHRDGNKRRLFDADNAAWGELEGERLLAEREYEETLPLEERSA